MGTASMYGNQVMDVELDCEWMSIYATIEYTIYSADNEEDLVELVSVKSRGVDITNWINTSYIFDLISDEISNADYHHSDHGD
jgi:hypothetical protein